MFRLKDDSSQRLLDVEICLPLVFWLYSKSPMPVAARKPPLNRERGEGKNKHGIRINNG